MSGRIWLDLTGVASGSEASVFAQRLAPAMLSLLGERLELCRREPGLVRLGWDDLGRAFQGRTASPPLHLRVITALAAAGAGLPAGTRVALRRAIGLQRLAMRALLPPPSRAQANETLATDAIRPSGGDTLLMLSPAGDASRFHYQGARLAMLPADSLALDRPDWLSTPALEQATLWRQTTAHVIGTWLSCAEGSVPGAGQKLAATAPLRPPPAPGFILADGEIGIPGATPQLLLAWRSLLDAGCHLPILVLAGRVGDRAADSLAQLRNSHCFGGSVILFADPTEAERAALRRECRFTLALERHGWGRAALDSLRMGRPCLSARPIGGARPVDPTSATALAAILAEWIAAPPAAPVPDSRSWDDVAADLLARLAA